MKLSVICTAFNAGKYLQDSIDSLLNQIYSDFELILVDDGSTDNTLEIMKENKNKFKKCRLLINKYNEGIASSRNRALLESQGEYIAIHDADDLSLENRFSEEIKFLDSHKDISIVGSFAIKINHSGEEIGSMTYPAHDTTKAFELITKFKLNPIIDPSSMYRRNIVIKHGGYSVDPKTSIAPDFELWCRLLTRGDLLSNISMPLIKYRINMNGTTRSRQKEMMDATIVIWSKFRRKTFEDFRLSAKSFLKDDYLEIK